jgi:predicted RNase H-like HicB family nuclease
MSPCPRSALSFPMIQPNDARHRTASLFRAARPKAPWPGLRFMDGVPEDMLGLEESQGEGPLTTCLCLKGFTMRRLFTLECWRDGDWYVGRLMEVPGVFSQGESLDELRENIQEAYELMVTQDRTATPLIAERQDVELEV